jgi:hypothetical protein
MWGRAPSPVQPSAARRKRGTDPDAATRPSPQLIFRCGHNSRGLRIKRHRRMLMYDLPRAFHQPVHSRNPNPKRIPRQSRKPRKVIRNRQFAANRNRNIPRLHPKRRRKVRQRSLPHPPPVCGRTNLKRRFHVEHAELSGVVAHDSINILRAHRLLLISNNPQNFGLTMQIRMLRCHRALLSLRR